MTWQCWQWNRGSGSAYTHAHTHTHTHTICDKECTVAPGTREGMTDLEHLLIAHICFANGCSLQSWMHLKLVAWWAMNRVGRETVYDCKEEQCIMFIIFLNVYSKMTVKTPLQNILISNKCFGFIESWRKKYIRVSTKILGRQFNFWLNNCSLGEHKRGKKSYWPQTFDWQCL